MEFDVIVMQKCLLSLIKQFHEFAIKNNLTYFIASGTLLGAIRHRGFIPWDDDIDIYMLRKDYDLFIHELYKAMPENLELRCFTTCDRMPTHFAKIIDSNTTLIENKFTNYVEGIYIDVFPLDGIDPVSRLDRLRWSYARFLNSVLISKHQTTRKDSLVKRIVHFFCRFASERYLQKQIDLIIKSKTTDKSIFVGAYLGAYNKKEIFDKKIFLKPTLYQFENIKLFGVHDYDVYLTQVYGDYMKLPPKEERKHKHDAFYIDFKKSYKDYKLITKED